MLQPRKGTNAGSVSNGGQREPIKPAVEVHHFGVVVFIGCFHYRNCSSIPAFFNHASHSLAAVLTFGFH